LEYTDRFYRRGYRQDDLVHFQAAVAETDLNIGVNKEQYSKELVALAKKIIKDVRRPLEEYIKKDPRFLTALTPYELLSGAPEIARVMADAGFAANVGPMAAVAGAIAEAVGKTLAERFCDVIVENGGDIYMKTSGVRRVGIFAGESVLSGRVAIEIEPHETPVGICTSSGKVGPSLSFGKTDAVVVLSTSAALADAAATACGNIVQSADDIEKALDLADGIKSVLGVVIVIGDHLGVRGKVKLVKAIRFK
jgi:ApbE superfamily uncharacterized protein (UPF0280 family)